MHSITTGGTMADQAECCPRFNPEPWNDRIIEWNKKKFIKARVFTFFYMPVNFGKVMRRLDTQVRKAGAEMIDYLSLSNHTSKWNMDVYVAVNKEISSAENTTLSGRYYSRVYEGPFRDTGKWCNDYEGAVKSKGYAAKKMFMWYTTCPKCAKKYGKNYVAIISEIA
jgi:hypothetical protein